MNKTSKRHTGDIGEDLACRHYIDRNYSIIDRNVNIHGVGEIDLIVGREYTNHIEIVFVEVKTRNGTSFGYGYESVDAKKLNKVRKCAAIYTSENRNKIRGNILWRFDVASIVMTNPPTINVYENIDSDI